MRSLIAGRRSRVADSGVSQSGPDPTDEAYGEVAASPLATSSREQFSVPDAARQLLKQPLY